MFKIIYYIIRITIGEPVSANVLTHTHTDAYTEKHTHADNAMELC